LDRAVVSVSEKCSTLLLNRAGFYEKSLIALSTISVSLIVAIEKRKAAAFKLTFASILSNKLDSFSEE
jgi:hypothetical protein